MVIPSAQRGEEVVNLGVEGSVGRIAYCTGMAGGILAHNSQLTHEFNRRTHVVVRSSVCLRSTVEPGCLYAKPKLHKITLLSSELLEKHCLSVTRPSCFPNIKLKHLPPRDMQRIAAPMTGVGGHSVLTGRRFCFLHLPFLARFPGACTVLGKTTLLQTDEHGPQVASALCKDRLTSSFIYRGDGIFVHNSDQALAVPHFTDLPLCMYIASCCSELAYKMRA